MKAYIEFFIYFIEKNIENNGTIIIISGISGPIIELIIRCLFFKYRNKHKLNKVMQKELLEEMQKGTYEEDDLFFMLDDDNNEDKNTIDKISYSDEKQNSIVEMICNKKIDQYNYASIIICICIVFCFFINIIFATSIKMEVMIFLYALFGFIIVSRFLIGYRLKKGYYGTNYVESKEILYYLTVDKDKNDKNSGKKIFNDIGAYNKVSEQLPEVNGELQY